MKNKKIIVISIIAALFLQIFGIKSYAATGSFSIGAGSAQLEVGGTTSITIKANECAGQFTVSSSDVSVVSINGTGDFLDNSSRTFTATAKKAGTARITVNAQDVTDTSENNVSGSKSVTITVKAKEQAQTQSQQPTQQQTTQQQQPIQQQSAQLAEPNFTNTNRTMYTTGNINLRSSWSTSSAETRVPAGTEVTVTATSTNKVNGYVWYRVSYNGQTRYVASGLLTATKPVVEEQKQEENKEEEQKQEEKQPEVSSNKALKDLVVEDYKLTPDFDPENTKYSLTLKNEDDKLNIKATPQDENAKVDITGNENFTIGNNLVKITVTATDGTTRMYTIAVSKSNEETEKDMLKLSNLKVNGATLSPEFSRDVTNYEITVDDPTTIKAENVVAVPVDTGVEVTVAEESKTENGEKVITIMLENEDGTKTGVYQIAVKKTPSNPIAAIQNSAKNNDNKIYYILGGIMAALVILIIIIAVLLKRTSNEDDDDINDADELSDDYDYSLKNAIEQANGNAESENEYDEMVEKSNVKSQIINPTDYNVFKNVNDEVGVDKIQDDEDYTPDLKLKKKGKHF